ncbi:DUF5063 domain-containing protein [Planctomycetota bacterium]|nr:DUF5063 domain-containing protein [Planctomycetota bacterium]
MTTSEQQHIALTNFAQIAQVYCTFIDSLEHTKPPKLYSQLESLLIKLHTAILPIRPLLGDVEHDHLDMTHEQRKNIAQIIANAVAAETHQLMDDFESLGGHEDYIRRINMFWDDLNDIYSDLADGLARWNLGTQDAHDDAQWVWRRGFEIHWGEHLTRAAQTIHEIRYTLHLD